MQIGVIGSENHATKNALKQAYDLGKEIGKRKHILICGGRKGIMEQVCKGAKEENGQVVGILPTSDGSDANSYLGVQIRTGLGFARNALVAHSADVLIVLGGGCGTLSEICFGWVEKKRIIVLQGSGGWADKIGGEKIDEKREDRIIIAKNIYEAIDLAEKKS